MRYIKTFTRLEYDVEINDWIKKNNCHIVSFVREDRRITIMYEVNKDNEKDKEEIKKFIIETVHEEVKAIREIYESFAQLNKT